METGTIIGGDNYKQGTTLKERDNCMLYLGEKDILKAVTYADVMDSIEKAFHVYEKGDYVMPPRIHVDNKENTILYMPCFTSSIIGTKMLTLFPGNSKINKPVIEGLVVLNDVSTGRPLALLNGAKITAVRTGAVGGLGVRHLTHSTVKSIGLIGAGMQGFHQMLFACEARDIKNIFVFDTFIDKLPQFISRLEKTLPGVQIKAVKTVEELVGLSEIIVTTTTSSTPVLPNDEKLLKDKHFIGIGSYAPHMREYPEAIFRLLDKVYIDTDHGIEESGDLIIPLQNNWITRDRIETFGHYLSHNESKEVSGTTLFKSVGMALLDIVISELVYDKAMEKGIGQEISY